MVCWGKAGPGRLMSGLVWSGMSASGKVRCGKESPKSVIALRGASKAFGLARKGKVWKGTVRCGSARPGCFGLGKVL